MSISVSFTLKDDRFAVIDYLNGMLYNKIDDEKIKRARNRMEQVLDNSVSSSDAIEDKNNQFAVYKNKVIDLSKINLDDLKKKLETTPYRAIEIDDLKEYIERALKQMINMNVTRQNFLRDIKIL